jgi:hypothetical protein
VFRVTRQRTLRDRETGELKTTINVDYGITDLSREQADAKRLLAFNRGHRGIENKVHDTRDVTLREDAQQAKSGNGPRIMAAMRNTATSPCRLYNSLILAEARREFAWDSSLLLRSFGFVMN